VLKPLGAVAAALALLATTAGTSVGGPAAVPLSGTPVDISADTPAGPARSAAQAARGRSNVVLVLMDDMRRDDLPWMPKVRKRIADKGTTYSRYYTPLALCCPARASLLRGQYPHNTGVLTNAEPDGGNAGFLKLDKSTLATWMDPRYKTAYVGKYFNGYEDPAQRYVPPGWDDWKGTINTYGYLGTITNNNGTPVDNRGINSPSVFADQAVDFIADRKRSRRPFFLHLSFVTPHSGGPHTDGDAGQGYGTPYVPPRDRGTYKGPPHALHAGYNERDVSDKTGPVASMPRLSRADRDLVRLATRQRREALASADRAIDKVLGALRRTGQLKDTYVVFTSDNGYLLGEHRFAEGKRQPYEESSNLPLLIRGPGVPQDRWNGMAVTPDLTRTILDMANIPPRQATPGVRLDGRSILPERSGLDNARQRTILLEGAKLPVDAENGGDIRYAERRPVRDTEFLYRAVVTRRWKLIEWNPFEPPQQRGFELYDLRADPHETASVYGDDGLRKKTRQLKRSLEQLWMCRGKQCR